MDEAEGAPTRRAAASAPIPIPRTEPTELHNLISAKRWPAVIGHCRANPHEVGSYSRCRDERGYTALHALLAYNQSTPGVELVPVIEAILRAADEIDFGAEYRLGRGEDGTEDGSKINTNEIVEGEGEAAREVASGRRGGSWRLLRDQSNRAQWSPLHLTCVQGGINSAKVPVIKALLQIDDRENEDGDQDFKQNQKDILSLSDRQNRNVLHHLLDSVVPKDETFDAIRFILAQTPSLLFQRDNRAKTPLQYVLERIMENPGTRRRHYMNSYGNNDEGMMKNYLMLKLLVERMAQEAQSLEEVNGGGKRLIGCRGRFCISDIK